VSETTYVPRAGSKAEAAVAALGQRKWLCAADLALEIGCDRNAVDQNIAVAIREGLIRRLARDGKAGFALGSTGDPPARDVEDEGGTKIRVQAHRKPKKSAPETKPAKPKRAKPAKRQVLVVQEPPAPHPANGGQAVGILEDGTIVIIDEQGHAMSLPASTARRVAELVARTDEQHENYASHHFARPRYALHARLRRGHW